ncbi:MAG: ATP-binding protein [Opitutales bacterium]|nr:ATP-binding protein [Opitutales bacterium]
MNAPSIRNPHFIAVLILYLTCAAGLLAFPKKDFNESEALALLDETEGLARVAVLIDLADYYAYIKDHWKTDGMLEEATNWLEGYQNLKTDSYACALYAQAQSLLLNDDEALEWGGRARFLAEQQEKVEVELMSLKTLGDTLLRSQNYEKSISYYLRGIELCDQLGLDRDKALMFNNLSICYMQLREWKKAEIYVADALELVGKDDDLYWPLEINYCSSIIRLREYEEAEERLLKGKRYFEKKEMHHFYALTLSVLAGMERARGNPEKSLEYAKEVFERGELLHRKYLVSRTYRYEAEVLEQLNRSEEAKKSFHKALEIAKRNNLNVEEVAAYRALIDFYKEQGDFENTYFYQSGLMTLERAVFDRKVKAQRILYDLQFEMEEMAREIELLNKEKEISEIKLIQQELRAQRSEHELLVSRKQNQVKAYQRNFVILAFILTSLLGVVIYKRYRDIGKVNRQILEQKQEIADNHEKLKKLLKEKDEILGIVAHDLKNPLMNLIGIGDLLIEGWKDYDENQLKDLLDSSVESSLQMREIITNLLDLNRIEVGEVAPKIEAVDVKELIENIIDGQRFRLKEKKQSIRTDFDHYSSILSSDRFICRQIFENLISNALKFSPVGGIITVYIQTEKEVLRICVEDQGPGISEDEQKKLFQKYSRLSAKPTGGEPTVGLGLSIVKKLTEILGGKVWCESELGKGSRFYVELSSSV